MSYVIHVWEAAEPSGFDAAQRMLDALAGGDGGSNPKFIVLAKLLMAHCRVRDSDGTSAVFSDGELDGQSDGPVYVIGLLAPDPAVLRFVVQAARQLGLHVFDMQAGMVFCANGAVHRSQHGDDAPAQALAARISGGELKKAINVALAALLEGTGFQSKRRGAPVVRPLPCGFQSIEVVVYDRDDSWEFSLMFRVRYDEVQAIFDPLMDISPEYRETSTSCDLFMAHFETGNNGQRAGSRYTVVTANDLARTIEKIAPVIVGKVMALLDRCRDVNGFHQAFLADGPARPSQGYNLSPETQLIIARLAGDPDFERHVRYHEDDYTARKHHALGRAQLDATIAFLRRYDRAHPVLPRNPVQ